MSDGGSARPGEILEAVAAAAERFLSAQGWEGQIGAVLADLGRAAGVSRVYLFENVREEGRVVACRQVAEWSAPGISPQIDNPNLNRVPYVPDFERWLHALSGGAGLQGDVRDFPGPERAWLEPQDIDSLAVVPMFAGSDWWGFLGFDECFRLRRWTPAEIGALTAAAGIVGAAIQRGRSETVLREAEDRYRRLVELSPDAIAVHRGGVVTFANTRMLRLLRAKGADDVVGHSVLQFVDQESRPRVLERLRQLREGREVPPIEERLVRVDGTPVDVEITSAPFTDVTGASSAQVVIRDITDRKDTERSLRVHGEYLEALHDTALTLANRLEVQDLLGDIVGRAAALLGADSGYLDVMAEDGQALELTVGVGAFRDWVGLRTRPGQGLAGRVWDSGRPLAIADYAAWEGRMEELAEESVRAAAAAPLTSEGRVVGVLGLSHSQAGTTFSDEDVGVLSRFAELASVALGNARLYTQARQELEERRRAEERLQFSAHLLDSVENAVIATEGGDAISYWNAFAASLYGWRAEEVVGRSFREVLGIGDQAAAAVDRVVGRGQTWEGDLEVRRRDGRPLIAFARISPIRSEEDRAMGFIGVMVDVTERRRAEDALREAFEREKEVSRRLLALDEMKNTFLEAVSHELRTPLSAILGFSMTLQRSDVSLSDDRAKELLVRLDANARKLERLLSDLLDLDRLSRGIVEPRRRAVDLAELVRQVIDGSEAAALRGVEVDAEPVIAWIDGPKVERIVENLVANAIRHTPEGTPVWVRVRREGDGVLIAVEDAGPGVPEELRAEIFEPFRQGPQTHSNSKGVGVGLSLVAKFAELHGGRAWVEEREGGGTAFRVWLPNVEPDGPDAWAAGIARSPHEVHVPGIS